MASARNNNISYRAEQRVFDFLLDEVAHLDRVDVGLWGQLREDEGPGVHVKIDRPILRQGAFYSRGSFGQCRSSGNPFVLKYGVTKGFPHLAPYRLSMRSDSAPLSSRQIMETVRALFTRIDAEQVSLVEFAFDLTTSFLVLNHYALPVTRRTRLIDRGHGRTIYFGSPVSPLQIRLYEKTLLTTRLEFILRRAFLRTAGIERIQDLQKLRLLRIWDKLTFVTLSAQAIAESLGMKPGTLAYAVTKAWPFSVPVRLAKDLARERRAPVQGLFDGHQLQSKLKAMQENAIL
jgi:hypothetical protein